jgi:hypothetical protein
VKSQTIHELPHMNIVLIFTIKYFTRTTTLLQQAEGNTKLHRSSSTSDMIKMVAIAMNVVVDLQNVGDDVKNEDFAAVAAIKLDRKPNDTHLPVTHTQFPKTLANFVTAFKNLDIFNP